MGKSKCRGCEKICEKKKKCKPKDPVANIVATCPPPKIRRGLALQMTWKMRFNFFEDINISPISFEAKGLFCIECGCLQSVTTAFFAPNRVPTFEDFNQSTLCLDIPGFGGTITGEVYFFGDRVDYTAVLTPYLLEDGQVATLLTRSVTSNGSTNSSVQLVFVARLYYCAIPKK